MTGAVKLWDKNRGFGFLLPDDGGPDVFVHVTELRRAGIAELEPGQRVEFLQEQDPATRKVRAIDLRPIA